MKGPRPVFYRQMTEADVTTAEEWVHEASLLLPIRQPEKPAVA